MPLQTSAVGLRLKPWSGHVDARWLMAYAAGLGRDDDDYLDTTRPGGVVAHPVFPVAPEWGQLTAPDAGLDVGLSRAEATRGVHAAHDVHLHRPLHQDTDVTVEAEVTAVSATPAGARITMRFEGTESPGAPLWTTWMTSIYRGVETTGADAETAKAPALPDVPEGPVRHTHDVELSSVAGQVYNECARLWNPIHSDLAVARSAGLDRPILHGSATFAHGVGVVLDQLAADPTTVRRIGASFRGMVPFPSTVRVEVGQEQDTAEGRLVGFRVLSAGGTVALRDAFVVLG